jgi:hypothetical protein
MMLSKEKPLADDPAKPWQGVDIEKVLLPLLLQPALTGTKIDTTDLLSLILNGKPGASAANTSAPTAAGQQAVDINALLLPLLFQILTGKPWSDTASPGRALEP